MISALVLEDLAYAFYVHEYTSGNFDLALLCADRSIDTLTKLGHEYCMQCASARRVKGSFLFWLQCIFYYHYYMAVSIFYTNFS